MGRLIDSDALKNVLYEKAMSMSGYRLQGLEIAINIVYEQPTAYDVDKVVAELEEWTFNADVNIGDGTIMNQNLIASKNAIDIVRKGGAT